MDSGSGEHALLAFLDLSLAFETADRDILLTRLSRSAKHTCTHTHTHTHYTIWRHRVIELWYAVWRPAILYVGSPLFVLYTADLDVELTLLRRRLTAVYVSARQQETRDAEN